MWWWWQSNHSAKRYWWTQLLWLTWKVKRQFINNVSLTGLKGSFALINPFSLAVSCFVIWFLIHSISLKIIPFVSVNSLLCNIQWSIFVGTLVIYTHFCNLYCQEYENLGWKFYNFKQFFVLFNPRNNFKTSCWV